MMMKVRCMDLVNYKYLLKVFLIKLPEFLHSRRPKQQ
jgi:hypothetical protein